MSAGASHLETARALYAERDLLTRALADLDAKLKAERQSYSFAAGYRAIIREESFRREATSHG